MVIQKDLKTPTSKIKLIIDSSSLKNGKCYWISQIFVAIKTFGNTLLILSDATVAGTRR